MPKTNSIVEFHWGEVIKTPLGRKATYLLKNEIRALKLLDEKDHFPQFICSNNKSVTMTYCGKRAAKQSIPDDYEKQINEILFSLKEVGLQHNDIKPEELLILNNKIYLCDFGWSTMIGDPTPKWWPKELGAGFRPENRDFDDRYSIFKSIEFILNHKEKL